MADEEEIAGRGACMLLLKRLSPLRVDDEAEVAPDWPRREAELGRPDDDVLVDDVAPLVEEAAPAASAAELETAPPRTLDLDAALNREAEAVDVAEDVEDAGMGVSEAVVPTRPLLAVVDVNVATMAARTFLY